MRVLLAPLEIAGQVALTAAGLRAEGHDAVAYCEPHPMRYAITHSGPRGRWPLGWKLQRIAYAPWALARTDVFHYQNGTSLIPAAGYLDARAARRLGRRVVVEFWGGDLRMPDIEAARNPFYVPHPSEDGSGRDRLRRWMEVTDGHVVVADHFGDAHLEGIATHVHVVGQRVDLARFTPRPPDPDRAEPILLHAPSNLEVKGTSVIRAAVEELERRGRRFRYVEMTGVTNDQVLAILADADIVIDQIRLGSHGIFAVEAMAAGKPVVCRISDEMAAAYPADLPIVSADPTDLTDVLDGLIADGERRHRLGVAGRAYAETHHDHRLVARRLLDVYASLPT